MSKLSMYFSLNTTNQYINISFVIEVIEVIHHLSNADLIQRRLVNFSRDIPKSLVGQM